MKQTKLIMGMPVTVEVVDMAATQKNFDLVFDYFNFVDEKFSTYKPESEISKINRGKILPEAFSAEMKEILTLSDKTKLDTKGFFDIKNPSGSLDPSGLVKGWAIHNAAQILFHQGFKNFFVEAGGDIQASGHNSHGQIWTIGIRNPFKHSEVVKIVNLKDMGMATSGSYERGGHIYNPHIPSSEITDIVSLTVIGPNVYEADRFATAAFAMGREGINFIESRRELEGYMIDKEGMATYTSGFDKYLLKN